MTRARHHDDAAVGIVASAFYPNVGGVEELVRQLALALQAEGTRPTVFTMRWPTSLPETEDVQGVPVRRFTFRSPDGGVANAGRALVDGPITLTRFILSVRRSRCRLLHIQCVSNSAWFALQAARTLRIPLVVTLQGELTMDATGLYQRSRFARHALRQVLQHSSAITACSQATLHEAERWMGTEFGARGRVIHNGVRVQDFTTAVPHDEGAPYVFAVGRHVRQKGFDVLLEAMALLVQDPAFRHRLLLAGDGPERSSLEELATRLGLDQRVRFLGATDHVQTASLFRGSDLFVLPSRHEPFGIVNLEAMAAEVPVVATSVGGVPEFVIDGETGVLVQPDNASSLAAGIERLLFGHTLRDACVRNGERVAMQHDWSVITAHYVDLYRSV